MSLSERLGFSPKPKTQPETDLPAIQTNPDDSHALLYEIDGQTVSVKLKKGADPEIARRTIPFI